MNELVIDCSNIESEQEFWAKYAEQLNSESSRHFGRNLDAFWDALSAGGPGFPESEQVTIKNSSVLSPLREGLFLIKLKEIAKDLSAEKSAVLLRLE